MTRMAGVENELVEVAASVIKLSGREDLKDLRSYL